MSSTAAEKEIEEMDLNWSGMLTTKNIDQVAKLLHQLLDGNKHTFVSANEFYGFKPKVETDQKLTPEKTESGKAINVSHHAKDHASLFITHSGGVLICSTNLVEDIYDPNFKNPYFNFEDDKVTITHRADAGQVLHWVAAVQKSDKLVRTLRNLAMEAADALWAITHGKKTERDPIAINQDIHRLRQQIDAAFPPLPNEKNKHI